VIKHLEYFRYSPLELRYVSNRHKFESYTQQETSIAWRSLYNESIERFCDEQQPTDASRQWYYRQRFHWTRNTERLDLVTIRCAWYPRDCRKCSRRSRYATFYQHASQADEHLHHQPIDS